jgi:hypothetical protein
LYEIEKKNDRFIVWRIAGKRKLRQSSFKTEDEAHKQIERSRRLQELREDAI